MPTSVLSPAELAHLAHAALAEVPACSPLLLLVVEEDDGLSFLVPSPVLAHGHDLVELAVGLELPSGSVGVAIAASGRAWSFDEHGRRGDVPAQVVVAHAAVRSGAAATYVTGEHGPVLLDEQGAGLVPDLARRLLGLPTPPPQHETHRYVLGRWLDALLAQAAARPGALSWPEVAAGHLAGGPEHLGEVAEDLQWMALALETARFAEAVPWAVLRRRFEAEGAPPVAAAASWFDDGSYSRWVLADLPSLDDALAALDELLPAVVARQVRATVVLADELVCGEDLLEEELWVEDLWDEEPFDEEPFDDEPDRRP